MIKPVFSVTRLLLVLLLSLFTISGCGNQGDVPGASGSLDQPNILWLVSEDMSANLGAWGDGYAQTPNLDELARQGVRYTQVFATAPACSPARSALITGVYATSTGTQGLRSQFPLPDYFHGFPSFLRQAGYYTTNNVKTDYNTSDEPRLIAESWDESSETAHWRGRAPGQPFFAVFNFMHTHQSRISFLDQEFPETRGFSSVHDPAEAPVPPFYPDSPPVRRTLARYYDAITAMDAEVGKILEQLEEDGLADETIVFFYTDHGMGLPRGKRTLYDSGLHVPLIVHFPEKYRHLAPAAAGDSVDRFVTFIDFAPTVLSLAGIPVPEYMQGRAFLGQAAGEPYEYVHGARDRVDEAYDLSRSIRDDRYLYVRHYRPDLSWNQPEGYSDMAPIRQEITRLANEGRLNNAQLTYAGPSKPVEELFDTENDPYQIHNLVESSEHQEVLKRMRTDLRAWELSSRDIGFMPEGELERRLKTGKTPWDIARDDEQYPLERILDAAELVGRPDAIDEQIRLLRDPDNVVRYWAAVGLRVAGKSAARAEQALLAALRDPVPEVQIQAAAALARLGNDSAAVETLTVGLESDEPYVVLLSARTLQLLGPRARPAHQIMERVLAASAADTAYSGLGMYLRFALEPALKSIQTTGTN